MIHLRKKKKNSKKISHRISLIRNLVKLLIIHNELKISLSKAKIIKPFLDKCITIAKKNNICARRNFISKLGSFNNICYNKVFNYLIYRYKNRNGGYSRILKSGYRNGDCSPISIIQIL